MTALSKEFYKQLNSIENFNRLDYNDPQVVAVRMRADHELTAMDNNRKFNIKKKAEKQTKRTLIYEMYQGNKLLAKGTAVEISELLEIKECSVRQMSSASYHKHIDKSRHRYSEKAGYAE